MNQKIKSIFLGSLPFLAILFFWQLFYHYQIIPRWFIPSPAQVTDQFFLLLSNGTLWELIAKSALNAMPGFVLAFFLALLLGLLSGLNQTIDKIFRPILTALYIMPSLIWLPLIVCFLGFTQKSIWGLVFLASFTKMIYTLNDGVRSIKTEWILAARNLGLSSLGIIWHVIIPAAFPSIITGLRLGFGAAWRSLIAAEMLVASIGGLGKFIWLAQWNFDYSKVIVGIISIAAIGIFIEYVVFRFLENRTLAKWGWLRQN